MGAIVLFDGVCNFCNGSVNFIINRDREAFFKFATLQSPIGAELLEKHNIDRAETDSVILIEHTEISMHSTAALRIARKLKGIWPLLYAFIIVPSPMRDFFYKLLAKYRYRLFGKMDVCMIPNPEIRARFL